MTTDATQPSTRSAGRLVIRVEITPEPGAQPAIPERFHRRMLAPVLGVVAVLTLTWVGISVFRSDPTSDPLVSDNQGSLKSQSPVPSSASNAGTPVAADAPPSKLSPLPSETELARRAAVQPRPIEAVPITPAVQQAYAPPSPIDEVLPEVPRSALQTIRGTVRVAIEVTIDGQGAVLEARSADPGPSRYFERLSLGAAKKWTFTPAPTQEDRIVLLRFHFTQNGATALAEPAD